MKTWPFVSQPVLECRSNSASSEWMSSLAHADEHVAFQINPVCRGIVPGEISFQDVVSPLKDNPALRLNDGIVAERDQFVRLKIPRKPPSKSSIGMVSTSVAAYEWTGEQRKSASRAMGAQTVFVTSRNIPRGEQHHGTVNFLLHPAFGRTIKMLRTGACLKRITPQQRSFVSLEPIAGRYPEASQRLPPSGCLLKTTRLHALDVRVYSSPFSNKTSSYSRRRGRRKKRILFPIHP